VESTDESSESVESVGAHVVVLLDPTYSYMTTLYNGGRTWNTETGGKCWGVRLIHTVLDYRTLKVLEYVLVGC
jgi:hypothetical protein